MKLNIESFRLCAMLEQVNGSFSSQHTLPGSLPADPPSSVAVVYVCIMASSINDSCLRRSQPGLVKASLRTRIDILLLLNMR